MYGYQSTNKYSTPRCHLRRTRADIPRRRRQAILLRPAVSQSATQPLLNCQPNCHPDLLLLLLHQHDYAKAAPEASPIAAAMKVLGHSTVPESFALCFAADVCPRIGRTTRGLRIPNNFLNQTSQSMHTIGRNFLLNNVQHDILGLLIGSYFLKI